ncbi:TPA: polyprenyl synthetase family protein [Neisseria meningitidis]|uniref:polyprenyl synthetase family protein n=1 Tax=Neisseria meningitidis TaxID=487 RepID=UPI00027CBB66|nr:farnesyl diphosphate synthase [Neisseria meningitidis]EJU73345.1 geranyltranstransferase [Neisseria meningitidis 80179]EOC08763.1 polyprenyl synthetase family protein [Neisseria meningitidis NM1482]EOC88527.1 polyprenyl synthetase family protein [Neisseria meningitidis NM23]MBG8582199.1 polyprenyl synthetase family protein [Neisseria meningitidis]MBH2354729.1 polyprenyl synthetase family protein [Neisseria meningitidis]
MNPTNDLKAWQQRAQAQTELLLERFLPSENEIPHTLHEAMRYAVLDGGKRLRPMLVLAASELGEAVHEAVEQAMAAIEMIHAYSLVHDDMPAMDNDSLRRGKPTCHIKYGEATALLVGDALQTQAFDVLSRPTELPAARQLAMLSVLAKAGGSRGMAGGQAIDLANVGKQMVQADLEQMHSLKTGALIRAAVLLGATACPDLSDAELAVLDAYAAKLGLAFQVIDDVLDCEADTATLGKTAGKDADNDKPTYVKLMGLEAARSYAHKLVAEAVALLEPFGDKALRLRQLAEFAVARKY